MDKYDIRAQLLQLSKIEYTNMREAFIIFNDYL